MTDSHRRQEHAPLAAHRDAVVGLRQLGDAVQGLRPAGRRPRPVREDRRRRDRQPLHRLRADRGAPHPVGPGRPLRGPRASSPPTQGIGIGSINANMFQDEDYRLGSVCNPDPRDPPQGHRPPARVRRDRGADRFAAPDAVVRRRHQLRGPGLDRGAPGPPRGGARRDVRGDAREPHDAARVQDLRARLLLRRTCPTGARACCTACASATARRCWSTPATMRRARTSR